MSSSEHIHDHDRMDVVISLTVQEHCYCNT